MKKSRWFKMFALPVAFAVLFSFTGCQKLSTELSEMMMIQGVAIDKNRNGYSVTIEMLNNEQNGSQNSQSPEQKSSLIYTAEGKNVSEALTNIVKKSGNKPMYAHVRVIIIGESVAKAGIQDIVDFFERANSTRPNVLVATARGCSGRELLSAQLETTMVHAEAIETMLTVSNDSSLCGNIRMLDVINAILDHTSSLYIPAVSLEKSNSGKMNYALDGSAVFGTDNRFVDFVDGRTTKGLLYLSDEIVNGNFTVQNSKKTATFYTKTAKTKIHIDTDRVLPVFHLKVKISCDLSEYSGGDLVNIDRETLKKLEEAAEKEVKTEIEDALMILQKELKCDVPRFGKRLELRDEKCYKRLQKDWAENFSRLPVTVSVKVTIRRTGEEHFFGSGKHFFGG